MSRPGVFEGTVDCCYNDMADTHSHRTGDQERLASKVVQEEDSGEGEDDLEDTGHTCGEEFSGDGGEAECTEDLRSVVQNCVDTSELLEYHDPAADIESLEHIGREQGFPGPKLCVSVQFCLSFFVEEDGDLDFEVFGAEERVFGSKTTKLGERRDTFFVAVLHHQPAGREREKEHSEEENPCWNELESERDTP